MRFPRELVEEIRSRNDIVELIGSYGDYFYLEALMRNLNPNFRKYW